MGRNLRVLSLGVVGYEEALLFQKNLVAFKKDDDILLLLEHPKVYTLGRNARLENVLKDPKSVGAKLVPSDRGGDVTYHGPGQLVAYLIRCLGANSRSIKDHVRRLEQAVIMTLFDLGVAAQRLEGYPGVWVGAKDKICAIGIHVKNNITYHGIALNVNCDLSMFDNIVPCGIADKSVTSLEALGIKISVAKAAKLLGKKITEAFGYENALIDEMKEEEQGRVLVNGADSKLRVRFLKSGVDLDNGYDFAHKKPEWAKKNFELKGDFNKVNNILKRRSLHTVCEEARCPNIYECWAESSATFLINGKTCTRSCSFCDVNTGRGDEIKENEPELVADALDQMGLAYAVITAPARDDLKDFGASGFVRTVEAIRKKNKDVKIELLIPDFKGDENVLKQIRDAKPDVLNHNIETVLRLQKAVRPNANYVRSLNVLAYFAKEGVITKSGIIAGMGETDEEIINTLFDLACVGVKIVTIGQYLRPSKHHANVMRYVKPEVFEYYKEQAVKMGFSHVEAGPVVRSSYRAHSAMLSAALASK